MNKIYFISFLSVLWIFAGTSLSAVYAGINKECASVSSETVVNKDAFMNAEDKGPDFIVVSGEEALEIMKAGVERSRIVELTLSIDGRTSTDITGLLRGSIGNYYLDEVKYASGTQLSYTVQYDRPYYPSDITVEGRGASEINVSIQKLGTYKVTFTVTGKGIMNIKAKNSASFVQLGIRIDTLQGVGPGY